MLFRSGEQKANEFVNKTFEKMLHNGLYCYDMVDYPMGGNVCMKFVKWWYDRADEMIIVVANWGPSKIHTPQGDKTIDEIIDEADKGEIGTVEDFLFELEKDIRIDFRRKTGLQIYFE